MSSGNGILQRAETEIRKIFKEKVDSGYTYHNIHHTMKVYEAVNELGKESGLHEEEIEDLKLAALFHDTGFTGGPVNHEQRSAAHAKSYLTSLGMEENRIDRIGAIILSTSKNAVPKTQLEEIIRDADLVGLADPMYQIESKALRDELAFIQGEPLSEKDWHTMNYQFMKDHDYHSEAAKTLYDKGKKSNIKAIKKILNQTFPNVTF